MSKGVIAKNRSTATANAIMPWRLSILLIAALLLGGTSQAIIAPKLVLNLLSLAIITQVLISPARRELAALLRFPIILGGVFIAVFAVYLLPIPPALWGGLSQSEIVLRGYELAGMTPMWRPLTLTPEDTAVTFWNFLAPVAAVMILVLDVRRGELKNSLKALIIFAIATIVLAVLQFAVPSDSFYFYEFSTTGLPTGPFSNTNHYGTFLAMILPTSVYYFFRYRKNDSGDMRFGLAVMLLAGAIPMIILTDSTSGYLIMPFILALAVLLLRSRSRTFKPLLLIAAIVPVLFLIDYLSKGQISNIILAQLTETGPASRRVIYQTIWTQGDLMSVLGTGPGSFYDVYLGLENRATMGTKFINMAHNDYLQVWLEMGLMGFTLMMFFLFYVIFKTAQHIFGGGTRLQIAAGLSVLAVMAASAVDYPLRTIGICVLMVFFTIIMAGLDRDSA